MENFKIKTQIFFGKGALENLSNLKNKKTFIVTDPFMVKSGAINKITERLEMANCEFLIFSDIVPDPPIENIIKGVNVMITFKPEIIVALGGGSAIDAAKAISWFNFKISSRLGVKENNRAKFIAIPTTSGTGSEVTSFSVITDKEKNIKYPLISDELLPDEAILDAEMVKTVPDFITADTGVDVLTHAIEAYVSTKATDYTDALAEKAIKIIFNNLITAYKKGDDMEAREKVHNASCIAGIAFNSASLGLNHGVAHAIGGRFHIPHGRCNAILLPYVIEFNSDIKRTSLYGKIEYTDAAKRYAEISKELGLPCPTITQGVKNLINAVNKLLSNLNIPTSFKDAGLDKEEFYKEVSVLAKRALEDRCTYTNPRKADAEEVEELLKKAYMGK